ncbi:MAG: hypothetical protein R3Y09_09735 [Clostridia bacterium]
MSFLEDLYFGKINGNNKEVVKGSEYQKEQKEFCRLADELVEKLKTEEKEMFENLTNINGTLSSISSVESFKYGFRIGAKMMLETFEKDDEQLKPLMD